MLYGPQGEGTQGLVAIGGTTHTHTLIAHTHHFSVWGEARQREREKEKVVYEEKNENCWFLDFMFIVNNKNLENWKDFATDLTLSILYFYWSWTFIGK